MAVLFIFIDGIGLGEESESNPFFTHSWPAFEWMSGGHFGRNYQSINESDHIFKGIDANLGVKGLPQSGTGQTALFTGVNASKKIGKHFGPFPHTGIKPFLKKDSIFQGVQSIGLKPYFMNAYPPVFFEHAKKRNRWSCTTLMTKSAEMPLHSTKEVLNEEALTAEIIQNAWREKLNIDLPKIEPEDAGQRILNILEQYDLVLYEYYLTDKAGHTQKKEDAIRVMDPLNIFLNYIIDNKKREDLLVISSDHGNLEDLSTKTHTRNPVPLLALGRDAGLFREVDSILGVKDSILKWLEREA